MVPKRRGAELHLTNSGVDLRNPDHVRRLAAVFDADTSQENRARLVEVMRSIGVERFTPGSDWPFSGPLDGYLNDAMGRLPLSSQEAASLRQRRIVVK
ncbi:MAG: hypothetical protein ACK4MH_10080 [Brevundimonas sp.]|uniref:hypothetical protein n=1 Tax=Brevundimonas sp. TaxID=1871086 RepID=UPI00391B460D